MGRSAITSHSKGKKHKDKEISRKSGFLLNSGVAVAEILWAIQTVLTQSSLHSCDGPSKLFSKMLVIV